MFQERLGVLAATCAARKRLPLRTSAIRRRLLFFIATAHVCDPPEAFILHREIVLTMKPDFTCARIS